MTLRSEALANARLAAIVGSSNDAIIGKGLDGIISDWNPAAEELFGYTAEEAIGQHISLIAPPGRRQEMEQIIARILRGEKVEHFETKRRHKDGRDIDIALTVSPIYDADGNVIGASKIARDITQQKKDAAELGLLAAIVDASDDAIISCDLDGVITSWNHSAERLYGFTAEEAVGHNTSLIAVPGREAGMAEMLLRIREGDQVDHYETERRRKDGTVVEISLTISPIYDGAGHIVGASKIARDISERLQADRRLKLLTGELDHRAKNVLAVAQSILRLTKAESLQDFVTAVEGRIRALARVHSQVAENRWDGAEIRQLAVSSLDAFGDGEGRVHLDGPRLWLTPPAAQVIGVVLHELATNAVKHGALSVEKGEVDISWGTAGNGALDLSWVERNGPAVREPTRRSFGAQVIERNVADQLGGSTDVEWRSDGLRCRFSVPPAHIVQMQPFQPKTPPGASATRFFAG